MSIGYWGTNSPDYWAHYNNAKVIGIYVTLVILVLVLLTSLCFNGIVLSRMRVLCDLSTIFGILAAAFLLIGYSSNSNILLSRVSIDFISYSLFLPLCQFCDNYIVCSLYILLDKPSSLQKVGLYGYVFILLIMPYCFFGSILPFFFNMNAVGARWAYLILAAVVYLIAYVIFYWRFVRRLRSLLKDSKASTQLSRRNIFHAYFSCFGAWAKSIEVIVPSLAPFGVLTQLLAIVLSLHFAFNATKIFVSIRPGPIEFSFRNSLIYPITFVRPTNDAVVEPVSHVSHFSHDPSTWLDDDGAEFELAKVISFAKSRAESIEDYFESIGPHNSHGASHTRAHSLSHVNTNVES